MHKGFAFGTPKAAQYDFSLIVRSGAKPKEHSAVRHRLDRREPQLSVWHGRMLVVASLGRQMTVAFLVACLPPDVDDLTSVFGILTSYFLMTLFEMEEVTDIKMLYVVQAEAIRRYMVHEEDRIESERLEPVRAI